MFVVNLCLVRRVPCAKSYVNEKNEDNDVSKDSPICTQPVEKIMAQLRSAHLVQDLLFNYFTSLGLDRYISNCHQLGDFPSHVEAKIVIFGN